MGEQPHHYLASLHYRPYKWGSMIGFLYLQTNKSWQRTLRGPRVLSVTSLSASVLREWHPRPYESVEPHTELSTTCQNTLESSP
jgi:hypothetical protein